MPIQYRVTWKSVNGCESYQMFASLVLANAQLLILVEAGFTEVRVWPVSVAPSPYQPKVENPNGEESKVDTRYEVVWEGSTGYTVRSKTFDSFRGALDYYNEKVKTGVASARIESTHADREPLTVHALFRPEEPKMTPADKEHALAAYRELHARLKVMEDSSNVSEGKTRAILQDCLATTNNLDVRMVNLFSAMQSLNEVILRPPTPSGGHTSRTANFVALDENHSDVSEATDLQVAIINMRKSIENLTATVNSFRSENKPSETGSEARILGTYHELRARLAALEIDIKDTLHKTRRDVVGAVTRLELAAENKPTPKAEATPSVRAEFEKVYGKIASSAVDSAKIATGATTITEPNKSPWDKLRATCAKHGDVDAAESRGAWMCFLIFVLPFILTAAVLSYWGGQQRERSKATDVGVGKWLITNPLTGDTEFIYTKGKE